MISNVLNIKQLEALVWVADLGSFRKAAHHLGTSQPNISARIAGLEGALGIVLMRRDAGSIELTEKGRQIVQAARGVLRQAEQIVEIAGRVDLVSDRLRLGVTELVACTWLHLYLRRIKAAFPNLNVELTVDLSRQLDAELQAGRLDLAIQTAPFSSAASGVIELGTFPYVWVAAASLAQHLVGRPRVAEILPFSVLTHARHTHAYSELSQYMRQQSLPTTRLVSSSSLASCVQMAADGMGVTLLPRALVERELNQGQLIEVNVDWLPAPLRFAARYQSARAPLYLESCAKLAQQAAQARLDDQ